MSETTHLLLTTPLVLDPFLWANPLFESTVVGSEREHGGEGTLPCAPGVYPIRCPAVQRVPLGSDSGVENQLETP